MPGQYDKFTQRARKVLTLAQEEARRFNHNYIGTEHLLLGLVREGDGVAARVLHEMGVRLPKVRSQVEFIIGRGETMIMGEIGLTPRAKKVIELAIEEARGLNHHYVGTEHLLLGIVREGEGIGAGVLESLGINLARVRTRILDILGASAGTPEPSAARPDGPGPVPRPPIRPRDVRGVVERVRRHARHHPEDLGLAVVVVLVLIWIELRRIGRRA